MSENQNRQPKGIPAGGQFAASARAEAENVALTDDDADIAYGGRPEPTREDLIGETKDCRECGETLIEDPSGSAGVWVHADEDGHPDYDKDLEHDPVPDESVDLGLADRAEAEMTALMDAENARNGAYDPAPITGFVQTAGTGKVLPDFPMGIEHSTCADCGGPTLLDPESYGAVHVDERGGLLSKDHPARAADTVTGGGPFEEDSGRCIACDGHYKHDPTCTTLRPTPDAADDAAPLPTEAEMVSQALARDVTGGYERTRALVAHELGHLRAGNGAASNIGEVVDAIDFCLSHGNPDRPLDDEETATLARLAAARTVWQATKDAGALQRGGSEEKALADALDAARTLADRRIRTFDGKTYHQWRAQAADCRRRSAESFARSDTDGFLSQWAADQMASKYDFCASIAEQGGRLSHPALFDLDGNAVPAKLIDGKYGQAWMMLDENGRSTGEFVNPSKAQSAEKRAVALAKKGYRTGRVMAPMAVNHRSGDAFRTDGGYSADNEVLYVVGADGTNPMRAKVEAEGGEFNEWYD